MTWRYCLVQNNKSVIRRGQALKMPSSFHCCVAKHCRLPNAWLPQSLLSPWKLLGYQSTNVKIRRSGGWLISYACLFLQFPLPSKRRQWRSNEKWTVLLDAYCYSIQREKLINYSSSHCRNHLLHAYIVCQLDVLVFKFSEWRWRSRLGSNGVKFRDGWVLHLL